jgi:hypothetical protein
MGDARAADALQWTIEQEQGVSAHGRAPGS